MKQLFIALSILLLLLCSCSNEEVITDETHIVGTWRLMEIIEGENDGTSLTSDEIAESNKKYNFEGTLRTFEFRKDKTLTYTHVFLPNPRFIMPYEAIWKIENETIITDIEYDDPEEAAMWEGEVLNTIRLTKEEKLFFFTFLRGEGSVKVRVEKTSE